MDDLRDDRNSFSEEPDNTEITGLSSGAAVRRWLAICLILIAVSCVAFGYGYRQHLQATGMTVQADELRVTVNQLQDQIKMLNSKLSDMIAAQQAAAAQAAVVEPAVTTELASARPSAAKRKTYAAKRRAPRTSSFRRLQARVDAQQKQLASMQDEMTKTRSDLQGNIDSTRYELNGSIAKTHDELVALEKRGERNYFEFDLDKSREFQRFGPLMLELRKADTKHKSYDMNLVVDDNRLSKKHVDLYEPIWLHAGDDAQPVQVVVNRIEKNHVHGYVSAPKYAEARQANPEPAPAGASQTPTSAAPASAPPGQNPPNPNPPQQE